VGVFLALWSVVVLRRSSSSSRKKSSKSASTTTRGVPPPLLLRHLRFRFVVVDTEEKWKEKNTSDGTISGARRASREREEAKRKRETSLLLSAQKRE